MKLNTKELLSGTKELSKTSGITYHKIETPRLWGDTTVNRSLYGYEVDRNFYNLKAEDIKGARWDASRDSIIIERWGLDELKVVIPISNIQKALKKHNSEIDELRNEIRLVDSMVGGSSADTAYLVNVVKDTIINDYTVLGNTEIVADLNREDKTMQFNLGAIVATMEPEE